MHTIFSLLVVTLSVWIVVRGFRNATKGDDLSRLPRIEEEFRTLVVHSELPELCFDGNTAEVVDDRQEGTDDECTFTLHRVHRFARNAYGEYFFMISEGSGKPFFKHVSQANAQIALGGKYIPPGPDEGCVRNGATINNTN
jgi:hypothetical protein